MSDTLPPVRRCDGRTTKGTQCRFVSRWLSQIDGKWLCVYHIIQGYEPPRPPKLRLIKGGKAE